MTCDEWLALATLCEQVVVSDREIDCELSRISAEGRVIQYTRSLDEITALIGIMLPGWSWCVTDRLDFRPISQIWTAEPASTASGEGTTPALALCAAFCRAMSRKGMATIDPRPSNAWKLYLQLLENRAEIKRLTKERDEAREDASANQQNCDAWFTSAIAGGRRIACLVDALGQAEEWFRTYGQGHDAKGDADKAKRNHDRADFCARAKLGDGT
jgi:hypothetical protein